MTRPPRPAATRPSPATATSAPSHSAAAPTSAPTSLPPITPPPAAGITAAGPDPARFPRPGSGQLVRVSTAVTTGAGAVVTGAAGTGRTALARASAAELEPRRFAPFWVVGTHAARSVPLGALAGLLPAGLLPTGLLPTGTDTSAGVEAPPVLNAVVDELLRRSGGRWPVLIVDDAHLLDGPSASVLLGLVLDGRVRLLVTARVPAGEGEPAVPDAVVALWKDGYLPRVELGALDHAGVADVVTSELGAPMAASGVDLLRQWTRGNPLHLTELLRHGRAEGLVRFEDGYWWWDAPLVVPPALEDLFDRRIDRLPATARDALAALALTEPLPLELLIRTTGAEAVLALEDAGLVRTSEVGEECEVRLEHPLLVAAVRRVTSSTRQRLVARALLEADAPPVADPPDGHAPGPGPAARALWQLTAGGPVDPQLLQQAAALTLHSDPPLSQRFARRALLESGRPQAAIALAKALTEGGEPEAAAAALAAARAQVDADLATAPAALRPGLEVERIEVAIALAGHRAWAERDPDGANEDLARLPPHPEVESIRALVLLFGGHAAEALALAERVLSAGGTGGGSARARAGLARTAALALVGRTQDAVDSGERLVAELERHGATLPYARGMARAALALARLWRAPTDQLPVSDPRSGRWPAEPRRPDQPPAADVQPSGWSLFDGYELRVRGDRAGAIRRLREALVQQSGGEALFRSEAAAWLAITLAETGAIDEAGAVLRRNPPDRIGLVPGLDGWARGALAQAAGDRATALARLRVAIRAARESGSRLVELGYLLTATEWAGHSDERDVDRLAELAAAVDAPRLVAVAYGVLALAGRRDDLAEVADGLEEAGVFRQALDVARAAQSAARGVRARAEADARVARLRSRLGLDDSSIRPAGLTAREWEVAGLAARGLSDRRIAERLVLSVRTVETHLARAYRKLRVTSRRELTDALDGLARTS